MNRRSFFHFLRGLPAVLATAVAAPVRASQQPPIELQKTIVAGFCYYAGGSIWQHLCIGDDLELVREPGNPHDPRAIAVYWKRYKLGYVPRVMNSMPSQMLDRGLTLKGRIEGLDASVKPWNLVAFSIFLA
jgi:hypothetical protein